VDIWAACRETAVIGPLSGKLVRVVESQEQVATNSLVDTLAEQELLEQMLETSKPPRPSGCQRLHYLLATPFRYPPLRHGSRFGARHQPSLLYGSVRMNTALAETAYYRLVFLAGMRLPPPRPLTTQHTAFAARYRTARGLRLQHPPFAAFESQLRNPGRYDDTQQLGDELRDENVEAIQYRAARDRRRGINVALFAPGALADTRPTWRERLLCQTRPDAVSFYNAESGTVTFPRADFLVNGELPEPAL
jgi:hypothetical protein